jgi:hypothetical protein
LSSEFSDFQRHRHAFVPGCPTALADVKNTRVKLHRKPYPIHDEAFKGLFPTLLSKEMPFLELSVSQDEGEILQSQKPLKVS